MGISHINSQDWKRGHIVGLQSFLSFYSVFMIFVVNGYHTMVEFKNQIYWCSSLMLTKFFTFDIFLILDATVTESCSIFWYLVNSPLMSLRDGIEQFRVSFIYKLYWLTSVFCFYLNSREVDLGFKKRLTCAIIYNNYKTWKVITVSSDMEINNVWKINTLHLMFCKCI